MKSRKGKKKKGESLSESLNLSAKSDLTEDGCSEINKSFHNEVTFPQQFKILLDEKSASSKLKTKHAAFFHPSIILAYGSPWYFYIEGEQSASLCVAYPLKTVKKATIVLPNDSLGFLHQDLVEIQPYVEKVNCAAEVGITVNSDVNIDENLQELVQDVLNNKRFFYNGMKLKCKSLAHTYEFSITKISSAEPETSQCDIDWTRTENNLTSIFEDSAKNSYSSSQLATDFSSMCLKEGESPICKNTESQRNNFKLDKEIQSKSTIPTFFTLNYRTTLFIQSNIDISVNEASSLCFSHIGGLKQEELENIKGFIDLFLYSEEKPDLTAGVLLFCGPSGTGKTMMTEAIRNEYHTHVEEILWFNLYATSMSKAEEELRLTFQRARDSAPSIVFMDDLNYLIPSNNGAHSVISRILSQEIKRCSGMQIIVIAAVNNLNFDTEALKSWDIMVEEVKFILPDINQREDIILKLLAEKSYSLSCEGIKQFASNSQGFSGKDLKDVLNDAVTLRFLKSKDGLSSKDNGGIITFEDIKIALKHKKPTLAQSEVKIKKVKWSDIGGMALVKEKLKDIVEGPLKHPDIYKRFNVKPSRGVLLYGPPGCSKTMIAKALATECDLNFISKNVSDIHNKYVGESEKAVSDLFLMARAKSPCIVFLDEIDALIPSRGSSTGSGVEERVVNTFLQEIDGIEELNNVIIIAATNRPDRIDEAFLRYGRINHYIYISLPDLEAREEILKLQMKKRIVASDFDYKHLAIKTEGYSGAEIVNLCNEAALELLTEDFNCKSPEFQMKHFDKALKTITPRTNKELLDFYENFNSKFCSR